MTDECRGLVHALNILSDKLKYAEENLEFNMQRGDRMQEKAELYKKGLDELKEDVSQMLGNNMTKEEFYRKWGISSYHVPIGVVE